MRTQRCLANLHDLRVTVGKIERDGNLMLAVENIQKSSIEHIFSLETVEEHVDLLLTEIHLCSNSKKRFSQKEGCKDAMEKTLSNDKWLHSAFI